MSGFTGLKRSLYVGQGFHVLFFNGCLSSCCTGAERPLTSAFIQLCQRNGAVIKTQQFPVQTVCEDVTMFLTLKSAQEC